MSLVNLHVDVLIEIASKMKVRDVFNLCEAHSSLKFLCSLESLWKTWVHRDFGVQKKEGDSWSETYSFLYELQEKAASIRSKIELQEYEEEWGIGWQLDYLPSLEILDIPGIDLSLVREADALTQTLQEDEEFHPIQMNLRYESSEGNFTLQLQFYNFPERFPEETTWILSPTSVKELLFRLLYHEVPLYDVNMNPIL